MSKFNAGDVVRFVWKKGSLVGCHHCDLSEYDGQRFVVRGISGACGRGACPRTMPVWHIRSGTHSWCYPESHLELVKSAVAPKFKKGDEVRLVWEKNGVKACTHIDKPPHAGCIGTLLALDDNVCTDCPNKHAHIWVVGWGTWNTDCWPSSHMELVKSAKGGAEAQEKEVVMHTWEFEIVVPQKLDADGVEVRKAQQLEHEAGLVEKPVAADLLVKYAEKILSANATGSEVSINVRPFVQ